MNQLVNPNLNAVGRIGYCLEYQANLWGTTHTEPYAWTAWLNTELPRYDTPPTDVSYPLWFSYFVNGLNEGHVVSYVPGQGYYSSPWELGTTHAVLPSIAEVERIYGVTYIGWSEDILNLRVVEETMQASTMTGGRIYNLLFHACNAGIAQRAQDANYEGYFGAEIGKEAGASYDTIIGSFQFDSLVAEARANANPGAIPVVTVNGLEYVPKS